MVSYLMSSTIHIETAIWSEDRLTTNIGRIYKKLFRFEFIIAAAKLLELLRWVTHVASGLRIIGNCSKITIGIFIILRILKEKILIR